MILTVVRKLIVCDRCRMIGPEAELAGEARAHAVRQGWRCDHRGDVCVECQVEERAPTVDRAT